MCGLKAFLRVDLPWRHAVCVCFPSSSLGGGGGEAFGLAGLLLPQSVNPVIYRPPSFDGEERLNRKNEINDD